MARLVWYSGLLQQITNQTASRRRWHEGTTPSRRKEGIIEADKLVLVQSADVVVDNLLALTADDVVVAPFGLLTVGCNADCVLAASLMHYVADLKPQCCIDTHTTMHQEGNQGSITKATSADANTKKLLNLFGI